ncbi:MAG: flagellar biosynthesis protein FlhA [Rhodospirillaceae bacterium]|nr:flagellar biosynthesis protein FlhA [Rhodospirillaceae bacterium]
MEAIQNIPGFSRLSNMFRSTLMPFGILAVVVLMVIPLPPLVLDVFFATNIMIGLLVLMLALHTFRPLDFSSFPTILLVATVLRLALNVASTRVVLSEGQNGPDAAGRVIEAFGEFVIGGNFAVGIFVFIILIIINLIVITKGAGRVSEVSARFTLDAMPGKQMAIDADINAGVLTPEDALKKREELGKETDFYSAMDGATKFVKGDAIAAVLILAINIIGGLSIGIGQHNLPVSVAAETYILLSVGDGLAAAIPSLLLSIGTAIIVTRVSAGRDMAEQVAEEMSISKAWYPVAAVLGLLGLIPGMPNILFFTFGITAAAIGFYISHRAKISPIEVGSKVVSVDDPQDEKAVEISEISDNAAISVILSFSLLDLIGGEDGAPLANRIASVRKELSKELGFIIPQVRITDDLTLPQDTYRIKIGQIILGEDVVFMGKKLALPSPDSIEKLDGINVKDPAFGMASTWIDSDQQVEAEGDHHVVVDPDAIIATHLSSIIKCNAHDILGQDDVQILLDNLTNTSPNLVESVIPKVINLSNLTSILKGLLEDRIPLTDLRKILEYVSNFQSKGMSNDEIAEALRPALVELLIQQIVPINEALPVVVFDSEIEQLLISAANQFDSEILMLEPSMAESIVTEVNLALENQAKIGKKGVVVTHASVRKKLMNFLSIHINDLIVLGVNEIPYRRQLEVIATISNEAKSSETGKE